MVELVLALQLKPLRSLLTPVHQSYGSLARAVKYPTQDVHVSSTLIT